MADFGRPGRKHETKLVIALAGGATVRTAAKAAGIGERTAHRHLEDPDFRRQVQKARAAMIDQATGQLARSSTRAAGTLRKLLASADERVKLAAARHVLTLLTHLRESGELLERLEALEAAVNNGRKIWASKAD